MERNLFIVAGCNGAGKTTASFTVLPHIIECSEFVNADNIAAGISPFNPASVAIEAGKIMLKRIQELLEAGVSFAIETTLATKTHVSLVHRAREKGYKVTLLYFWLESPQMAIERVAMRVSKGGHHIPDDVVIRRYYTGLKNLFELFMPVCDEWRLMDNTSGTANIIAEKLEFGSVINNHEIWAVINYQIYGT